MKRIFYLFFLLCTCCTGVQQPNAERDVSPGEYDLIYTEWFMNQAGALFVLAPWKYDFNKFEVTPDEIIAFQKREIKSRFGKKNNPQMKERIDEWLRAQREAMAVLNRGKDKKIKMESLRDLINMLDWQAEYVKRLQLRVTSS